MNKKVLCLSLFIGLTLFNYSVSYSKALAIDLDQLENSKKEKKANTFDKNDLKEKITKDILFDMLKTRFLTLDGHTDDYKYTMLEFSCHCNASEKFLFFDKKGVFVNAPKKEDIDNDEYLSLGTNFVLVNLLINDYNYILKDQDDLSTLDDKINELSKYLIKYYSTENSKSLDKVTDIIRNWKKEAEKKPLYTSLIDFADDYNKFIELTISEYKKVQKEAQDKINAEKEEELEKKKSKIKIQGKSKRPAD